MKLPGEVRSYQITGTAPLMGTQPADQSLLTRSLARRDAGLSDRDKKALASGITMTTVFTRSDANGDCLVFMDYMLRGFFKSALTALSPELGILAVKTKVDRYLFVAPREIPILRCGAQLYEEDDEYQRPVRVDGPYGQTVTLQSAERVYTPWELRFTLRLLQNDRTSRSNPLSWSAVESALDYGALSGIGKFRNGPFGTFEWRRME